MHTWILKYWEKFTEILNPPYERNLHVIYQKDGSVRFDIHKWFQSEAGKIQLDECKHFNELYKAGKIKIYN